MPAASWEAHRDFMFNLFAINPEGRIKSAFADYRGLVDFEAKYRATADRNVGSQMFPVTFSALSV
jgi:hypothetical protein